MRQSGGLLEVLERDLGLEVTHQCRPLFRDKLGKRAVKAGIASAELSELALLASPSEASASLGEALYKVKVITFG